MARTYSLPGFLLPAVVWIACALPLTGCTTASPLAYGTLVETVQSTTLREVRGIRPLEGDSGAEALAWLEDRATTDLNTIITRVQLPPYYLGRSMLRNEQNLVELNEGLSVNQQLVTLAHELGHLQHGNTGFSNGQREVFAQVVAMRVVAALGFDARDYTVQYLTFYKADIEVVEVLARDIEYAVQQILGPMTVRVSPERTTASNTGTARS